MLHTKRNLFATPASSRKQEPANLRDSSEPCGHEGTKQTCSRMDAVFGVHPTVLAESLRDGQLQPLIKVKVSAPPPKCLEQLLSGRRLQDESVRRIAQRGPTL